MDDKQAFSNESEHQNITNNGGSLIQGSKWKTGLSRLKNNVTKPTLLSLQIKNQENELNQKSVEDSKSQVKAVVVNIEEDSNQDSYLKTKQIKVNSNKKLLYSNKPLNKASSMNNPNTNHKLYLPSSIFNSNSNALNNEDLLNNDKKVHFNTEESTNNDFSTLQVEKVNNIHQNQLTQEITKSKQANKDTNLPANKAKSEPVFHNYKGRSMIDPSLVVYKSFEAHYKRKKEIIEDFKKKDWMASERVYKLRSQLTQKKMNWKEFNPKAKVTFFTDNYITEEVIEEARREKKLNELNDESSVIDARSRLPPDRQMSGYQHNRVYFWG